MKPTVFKRIGAYLLDLLIVTLLASLLSYLPFLNPNRVAYSEKYSELSNVYTRYSNNEISIDEYQEAYIPITYDLYRLNANYVVINIVVVLLYFGIMPFLTKGQTIGKKLFNLRIVSQSDKPLTITNYIIRSVVLYNIIISILKVIIVFVFNQGNYYNIYNSINISGYIITYITLFMVIVRKDNLGLHDLIAKTKVIKVSEEKVEKEQAVLVHEKEISKEEVKKEIKKKSTQKKTKTTKKSSSKK